MSRRTFEALAAQLKATRPGRHHPDGVQWYKDVAAVAQALKSINPAFNPQRFVHDVLNDK